MYLELHKRLFQTSLSCTLSNCDKAGVRLCEMQVKRAISNELWLPTSNIKNAVQREIIRGLGIALGFT